MKNFIIILGVLFLFASCDQEEGLKVTKNHKCEVTTLTKNELVDLLYAKDLKGIQFIDIRTPHQYSNGHLPNAINMPMNDFFDKHEFEKIDKEATLIIYGEDASTPKMIALLAQHYTGSKMYTAGGGYDYIKEKILNGFGINSGIYDDEKTLIDFQKASDEIKSRSGITTKTKRKPTKRKKLIKRKKKSVSGGCG